MIGKTIFFLISFIAAGVIWYLYAILRASGLSDRRMKGFNILCMVVPFWIILTALSTVAEPDFFQAAYFFRSIPLNIVPYISCWFLLNFSESKAADSRFIRYFSIGMPAVAIFLLFTNFYHNQYILEFGNPPVTGPAFLAHLTLSVAYMLVIYTVLVRYIIKNYRKNPPLILGGIGIVIPIATYVVYLFFPSIIPYDVTPIGYFFTIVFVAYSSYSSRLRKAKPGLLSNTLAAIAKSPEIAEGTIEDAARLISREGCIALDTYRIRIWNYDGETQTLKCIACYNNSLGEYTVQEDFNMQNIEGFGEYLASNRILAVSNAKEASASIGLSTPYDPEVCAVLFAPVSINLKVVGLVCVEQNHCDTFPEKREWSLEEQTFASSLADFMVIAITNIERQNLTRRLETELSKSSELWRVAYDNAPMGLITFADDRTILECNEAILSLLGVTEEYFRENFHLLSPEYQSDGVKSHDKWEDLRARVLEGEKLTFEWTHQRKDGSLIPCEVTVVRIKQGNAYVGMTYVYDLSNVKRMADELNRRKMEEEKHKAASEAKSRFLAKMSHELRTPMNSIIGFSGIAKSGDIPSETRGYLAKISESAYSLLEIVNDILDISKIESGKAELEYTSFDLCKIIAYCKSAFAAKANEKGLSLICLTEPVFEKKLIGDAAKLRKALLNLLSNAVKFTDNGTVELSASVTDSNDTNVTVHFEVKDTGIGINPGKINKIFEPFVQEDNSITRKYGGTGLGLAIAVNNIEMMGGKLKAESAPGIGSKFSFDLCFHIFSGRTQASLERNTNSSEKPCFEGEVLVCEDNVMNQEVICEYLARTGLKTFIAKNGKEGVDIAVRRIKNGEPSFDLIFMDIHMPEMDGIEAAKQIINAGCKTPIVALTAIITASDKKAYLAAGMKDCLPKPFTANDLWSCLLKFLKPVKMVSVKNASLEEEKDKHRMLESAFVKSNGDTFKKFASALEAKDLKLAHRIAHTLKSNAALIGRTSLQEAAQNAEAALAECIASGGAGIAKEAIDALETELAGVLKELEITPSSGQKAAESGGAVQIYNIEEALMLLDKLDELLENNNVGSIDLTGDLSCIPGTELLIEQVQNFDFDPARETLAELKRKLKEND